MEPDHPYYKVIVEDPRYENGPPKDKFPMFESLKLTIERTLPYWNDCIVPQLKEGKKILIAAHGNSLRGIVKHLDSKYISKCFLNYIYIFCQCHVFTLNNSLWFFVHSSLCSGFKKGP